MNNFLILTTLLAARLCLLPTRLVIIYGSTYEQFLSLQISQHKISVSLAIIGKDIYAGRMADHSHVSHTPSMRIVNQMRLMKPVLETDLNLSNLHLVLGGKLYPGRPQMLALTMNNGRKVQIFRRGCIQILGRIADEEAEGMRVEFIQRLSTNDKNLMCHHLRNSLIKTPLCTANIVVCARLQDKFSFSQFAHSNKSQFYEIEIFPAALIRKWWPAHVALFHNGNLIITGVKSLSQCEELISSLENYLCRI